MIAGYFTRLFMNLALFKIIGETGSKNIRETGSENASPERGKH